MAEAEAAAPKRSRDPDPDCYPSLAKLALVCAATYDGLKPALQLRRRLSAYEPPPSREAFFTGRGLRAAAERSERHGNFEEGHEWTRGV